MSTETRVSVFARLEDRIFEWFQRRCPHDPRYVTADILDADFMGGPGGEQAVEWCQRCGAYRRVFDPWNKNRKGDLHEPHATWTQWHRVAS